ncbi:MAG: PIN domain-containing protein [Polyangiaceae bacterium]
MIQLFVLDTGALIAMERRKQRSSFLVKAFQEGSAVLTAPMPVVTEWWRGRTDARDLILELVSVEHVSLSVAKAAGEALAAVPSATAIDAIVMAYAASRGAVVFTSDVVDLERLRNFFPTVRVLGV